MDQELDKILLSSEESSLEDKSIELLALITSSTHEDKPLYSLNQIYNALCRSGSYNLLVGNIVFHSQAHRYQDPLNVLPKLLFSPDSSAKDIALLIGNFCSGKEVIIAVQEAIELLERERDPDENKKWRSPNDQLLLLLQVCEAAIPRLKFRKKPASEMIRPLLVDFMSAFEVIGSKASGNEGREIITAVCNLAEKIAVWALTQPITETSELSTCNAVLQNTVESTVVYYSHCIQASLAIRTFQTCFPRLSAQSDPEPGWEGGANAMSKAIESYQHFGGKLAIVPSTATSSYLILLAHSEQTILDVPRLLNSVMPAVLASIQANSTLDETSSLLMKHLCRAKDQGNELSPDIIIPLSTVLPSLASSHPNPSVRHHLFRILSLVLSLTPSALRLQILKELTSDPDFPQMRAAAVSLVKEAIIEAIPSKTSRPNIFITPAFLQVLGPVLLRSYPPDFFSRDLSIEDLEESPELPRLAECLAFYYLLLLRDKDNRTGIRDHDSITSIEQSLLSPIRLVLSRWLSDDSKVPEEHSHAIMPLVSLKTGLERIDSAVKEIKAQGCKGQFA